MHLTLSLHHVGANGAECRADGTLLAPFDPAALLAALPPRHSRDAAAVRAFGALLWAALGGAALAARLAALPPAPTGTVRLRADDDALHALPWELAWRGQHDDDFLALEFLLLREVPNAPRPAPPTPNHPWRLVAQGSDPLLWEQRNPATGTLDRHYLRPLRVVRELEQLRRSLIEQAPPLPVRWQPIAPTAQALSELAVGDEPLLFHYTGHGDVHEGQALLCFDDGTGRMAPQPITALSRHLRGRTFLALLNACRTADAREPSANLALALVRGGVPVALGMRDVVEDDLAAALAPTFYRHLLSGAPPAEALWRARLRVQQGFPLDPLGWSLPTLFVAEGFDWPRVNAAPPPHQGDALPPLRLEALQAPAELVGRADELVALASAFVLDGKRAVTLRGAGGMGKTALSAALARRLRFHFRDGIFALSFVLPADTPLSAAHARQQLARLWGVQDPNFNQLSEEAQEIALLRAVQGRHLLLLCDNYETVLQRLGREEEEGARWGSAAGEAEGAPPAEGPPATLHTLLCRHFNSGELAVLGWDIAGLAPDQVGGVAAERAPRALALLDHLQRRGQLAALLPRLQQERPHQPWAEALAAHEHAQQGGGAPSSQRHEAEAVQRLAQRLKEGGTHLLFTTRQSPVSFEDLCYPSGAQGQQLGGLPVRDGAALFRRRLAGSERPFSEAFPAQVAEAVGGVPLFVELAARRWADSPQGEGDFLADIYGALEQARLEGVPPNRQSALANVRLSLDALPAEWRAHFLALTLVGNPTIQPLHGAVLWGMEDEERWFVQQAHERLAALAARSLLQAVGWDEAHNRALGYTLQPVVAQVARALADEATLAAPRARYAAWAAGVVRQSYNRDEFGDEQIIALTQIALPDIPAALPLLPPEEQGMAMWQAAYLLRRYGQPAEAERLLRVAEGAAADNDELQSRLFHEKANGLVLSGDLDGALDLYHQSLAIQERLGDVHGKSATLHNMANLLRTRGDLDGALDLYHQSLAIKERLGDVKGKSATLHQMANLLSTRGDLDGALDLYHQSLALDERLGDVHGKAVTLASVAQLYFGRGQKEAALVSLRESLAIFERLGAQREIAQVRAILAQMEGRSPASAQADLLPPDLPPARRAGRLVALATAALRGQLPRPLVAALLAPNGPPFDVALRAVLDGAEGTAAPLLRAAQPLLAGATPDEASDAWAGLANVAHEMGDAGSELAAREAAIAAQRAGGDAHETLVALSVMLYNLAMAQQRQGDFAAAVDALEEVVALDERTGHPDLESDRAALAQARQRAARDAAPPSQELAQVEAALAALPEAERLALLILARLAPLLSEVQRTLHHPQASAADHHRLAALLDDNAAHAADGEAPGSPWLDAAATLRHLAAHLRGQPASPEPLPSPFREAVAALLGGGTQEPPPAPHG